MKREKRFKVLKWDNKAVVTDRGKVLTKYQIVELLNRYYEENRRLKQKKR